MMRIIYITFFLAAFSLHAPGQYVEQNRKPIKDKFELEWGNELRAKNYAVKIAGTIAGNTFILKQYKKKFFLDKIDERLNLVKTIELEMKYKKAELLVQDVLTFNNRLFVIGSYENKKNNVRYIFYRELDARTMNYTGELEKIGQYSTKEENRARMGVFDVIKSQDSTKIMLYYNTPDVKNERDELGFYVYDKELGLLWDSHPLLPYEAGLFEIQDYKLDNNGNVYILGKLYEEKARDARKGKVNYEIRLLAFKSGEDEPVEYEIDLKEVFLKDLSISFTGSQIIAVGFYSSEAGSGAKGCFALSIDKESKEIMKMNLEEFEMDFITLDMTAKQEEKTKKKAKKGKTVEMNNLDVKHILQQDDGSFVVVAEEYFIDVITTYTQGANGTTIPNTIYLYNYFDIIVFGVNEDFEIDWYNKVPKAQVTSNDNGHYSSFFMMDMDEKLIFLFNDNIKNLHVSKSGSSYVFTGKNKTSVGVAVSMDYEGNLGKTKLFNVKSEEIIMRPQVCIVSGKGRAIITAQRKKDQRYARVMLSE